MTALLLVFGLFLFLMAVGQALISLVRPRNGVLWSWFVSPAVGLAVLVLLITRLNVWGLPVRVAGPWLTIGLGLFAAAVLLWRKPLFPTRKLAPFILLACGYLAYTGWPLLRFGFDWISYGNDDMANYCLAAERFLEHGYYDLPLQTDLEGRDYAQHYWFMHALQQIRPGSEMTVAWAASVTGRRAHEVFMPTILMLSMVQIFALGSIAIFRGRYRKVALLAFFFFATSPLFGLGTLYQLIAQVGGIAILLAAASTLLSARTLSARKAIIAGVLTASLAIFYPEVTPFLALSIIVFALKLRYGKSPEKFMRYVGFVAGTAVLTFLLIATNTYQFINTLVMQSVGSAGLGAMAEINDQSGGLVLFPWTLVPSFIPMLFGLHPFGVVGVHPLISIQIAVGFLFLGYILVRAARNVLDDAPAGYLSVVMLALGFYLFFKGQDFGLFKLAMFAQPILTLLIAQGFSRLLASTAPAARRLARPAFVLFFLCTVPSHVYYSYASLGTYGGGLTEVVSGSDLGVQFDVPSELPFEGIESDISNVVTAKMLSQYTQGWDTRFLSRSYMDNIANIAVLKFLRDPDPDLGPQARLVEKLSLLRGLLPPEIMEADVPNYRVMTIRKPGYDIETANNWTETSSRQLGYDGRLFVSVRTDLDHFNKVNPGTGWTVQHMYQYKLREEVSDRLVFIHSELSPHYYSSARFRAAFFQREPEPITGGEVYFHGTGRWNLFNIINPSPNLRLIIDFTRTYLGEERPGLPRDAVVIGEDDYALPFVGHGSARVVSPILTPEYFEGEAYITLDFRDPALPILKDKQGLMALYGRQFNLDDRRLVGFTRDISVITEEQYQAMERPTRIGQFPQDLSRYPGLEYSGLFEDGWIAEDAYFKLGSSRPGQLLTFKGYIPDVPVFRTDGVDVTVSINDTPTEIVNLKSGEFTLTRLVKEAAAITSISLHFSRAEVYAGNTDLREVSAFVRELSIDDLPDLAAFRSLANQSGDQFDLEGVDEDGWLAGSAAFDAPAFDDFKVLRIDLEMAGWAPVEDNSLVARLDGEVIESTRVPRATYQSVYLPLEPGTGHRVELAAGSVFPLPNDTRERSFLIRNISFENPSRTDLFARGWHASGYRFGIKGADNDGWVDRELTLRFPATQRFGTAIVEVVRFPSRSDQPLTVSRNGTAPESRTLGLEATEQVRIPIGPGGETQVTLSTPQAFPLSAPDTRERSFRIVNIDFVR
jgi:hypothetical protein